MRDKDGINDVDAEMKRLRKRRLEKGGFKHYVKVRIDRGGMNILKGCKDAVEWCEIMKRKML